MRKKIDHFEILSRKKIENKSKATLAFTKKKVKTRSLFNDCNGSESDLQRKMELNASKREIYLTSRNLNTNEKNVTEKVVQIRRQELMNATNLFVEEGCFGTVLSYDI